MNKMKERVFTPIPVDAENAAKVVIDAAFRVHTALGPGLLESVYEACMLHEIRKCGKLVEKQVILPIEYDGLSLDSGLRLDLLVEKSVIVEIKAVEEINPLYESQLLTYLKLTGFRLGLLINFNVTHLKNGIKRLVL
jgi:GxxExxY protein